MDFLNVLKMIAAFLIIAAGVTSIFYHLKRRKLFGGYIGGFIIAIIGAIIGDYVLGYLATEYVVKFFNYLIALTSVNVITGFLGAYGAVYLMNRLNNDKERTKY